MDGRRRRYVPLSVGFASGRTGTAILKKFGHAGLLTWISFLAACKRSQYQGTFRYGSEPDGWSQLGLDYPECPDFTLEAFFQHTGHLKQTRKRRVGRLTEITCTRWKEWNEGWDREAAAERSARKRAQNARTVEELSANDPRTDSDSEGEKNCSKAVEPAVESWERSHHFQRLLDLCSDADEKTSVTLRKATDGLSVAGLARIVEALRSYSKPNKSAYAYGTAVSMVAEGQFPRHTNGTVSPLRVASGDERGA